MAKRRPILNEQIRADNVRLIGQEGEQLGEMPFSKALSMAKEQEVDLVLVAVHPTLPVCKLLDYGKFQYQQNKQKRKQKVKQKKAEVKGIRIGLNIGKHDLEVRLKQAKKFISKGHPLKVQLQLKGREMIFKKNALERTKEFAEMLSEEATVEMPPKMQGYQVTMVLIPVKGKKKQAPQAAPKAAPAEAKKVEKKEEAPAKEEAA